MFGFHNDKHVSLLYDLLFSRRCHDNKPSFLVDTKSGKKGGKKDKDK